MQDCEVSLDTNLDFGVCFQAEPLWYWSIQRRRSVAGSYSITESHIPVLARRLGEDAFCTECLLRRLKKTDRKASDAPKKIKKNQGISTLITAMKRATMRLTMMSGIGAKPKRVQGWDGR